MLALVGLIALDGAWVDVLRDGLVAVAGGTGHRGCVFKADLVNAVPAVHLPGSHEEARRILGRYWRQTR